MSQKRYKIQTVTVEEIIGLIHCVPKKKTQNLLYNALADSSVDLIPLHRIIIVQ